MLIRTKLQTPSLRSRMLFRKALINRLCTAKEYPLILLSGPAGSGKTSLACQWVKREKLQVAWYSLDEEDNEPDLFFRYLLTTLAWTDERLNNAFSPMLENHQELEDETVIPYLIESLSSLSRNIHLALDDFHYITNMKILEAIARLIRYLPHRLHLVILSRHCLPTPMDAVSLKKERLELSASELKFTEKETADLFKEVIPLSISPAQIHDLNRHMEGWAAGLQLIGLSLRSQGRIVDLSKIMNQAHEQVANYLIHDILRMQSKKIRDFVFATALLDRFNPELCAEVTGMPDAANILERLARMNLFLVPLDTQRKWYRYHHIFSEVVRYQVAGLDSDLIPATLRKAAKWLAKNNHLEDAMRTAFRSNDLEFTADLMEDYITCYIAQYDLAAGLRWILKLPESVLNQHPLLRLQQCGFLSMLTEFSDIKEILLSIEKNENSSFSRYSNYKQALCQDYTAYLKCMLRVLYARETTDVAQFLALRNKISPQNPLLVNAIETIIVFTLILRGDLSLAEDMLAKLSKVTVSTSILQMRQKIYLAQAKALIARYRGRLLQSEEIILQVAQILNWHGYGNIPMAYLLHRHLGHILYLQNRLEEARECATIIVKHCKHNGLIDEIMAGNELTLRLHRAAGENEQAAQSIRQMQAYSIKLKMPRIAASANACAARFAIDQGNLAVAELWSRRRNLQPDEPFSLLFAMECITQARLFYAQKEYRKTTHLLKTLRNRCVKRTLAELVLQIDILQSAILHAINHPSKAVSLLKEALAFAETEGYLRPFINDSNLIEPVLRNISDERPCTVPAILLEKIFTACNLPLSRPTVPHSVDTNEHEDLTQREIEILEWMAQGFQNKEIAQKGCIAISTVKSHVSNILVKLSVKTRTQAILKAGEMNILKMG